MKAFELTWSWLFLPRGSSDFLPFSVAKFNLCLYPLLIFNLSDSNTTMFGPDYNSMKHPQADGERCSKFSIVNQTWNLYPTFMLTKIYLHHFEEHKKRNHNSANSNFFKDCEPSISMKSFQNKLLFGNFSCKSFHFTMRALQVLPICWVFNNSWILSLQV